MAAQGPGLGKSTDGRHGGQGTNHTGNARATAPLNLGAVVFLIVSTLLLRMRIFLACYAPGENRELQLTVQWTRKRGFQVKTCRVEGHNLWVSGIDSPSDVFEATFGGC